MNLNNFKVLFAEVSMFFFVQDESVKEFNKSWSGLLDPKAKLNNNGGNEKNCNILSAENFIFIDCFAVKVDGSDVYPGIWKQFSYRQIPGLTSLLSTLTAKKSMKMKFSVDKIYYNLFQENPKITNM